MTFGVTNHAKTRAIQRFGVDPKRVSQWFHHTMAKATYVSDTLDDNGKPGRLFASNGVGIVVAINKDVILTVMEPNKKPEVLRKFQRLAAKELEVAGRNEAKELRKLTKLQAELEIEIGELRLRLVRARSIAKRIAIQARINALKMRMDELPSEEHAVKRDRVRKVTALARVM